MTKKQDYNIHVGKGKLLPYNIKMITSNGDRVNVDIMINEDLLPDIPKQIKDRGMKLISLTRLKE